MNKMDELKDGSVTMIGSGNKIGMQIKKKQETFEERQDTTTPGAPGMIRSENKKSNTNNQKYIYVQKTAKKKENASHNCRPVPDPNITDNARGKFATQTKKYDEINQLVRP